MITHYTKVALQLSSFSDPNCVYSVLREKLVLVQAYLKWDQSALIERRKLVVQGRPGQDRRRGVGLHQRV